jgi:hypothetical protein
VNQNTRLLAAIERTFAEVNNGLLKLVAYNAICRANITYARMSFFVVASHALHNDMVSHAIRALDEHRDSASFWYVKRCNERATTLAARAAGIDLATLKCTSTKLRRIREKTHFHVDRDAVANPAHVWQTAGVTGDEFNGALRAVAAIMSGVKVNVFGGEPLDVTEYDGSDVKRIVKAYEELHGSVHGV